MKRKKKAKKSAKKKASRKKAGRKVAKKSVGKAKKKAKGRKGGLRTKKKRALKAKTRKKKASPSRALTKKTPSAPKPSPSGDVTYVTQTQRPLPGGFEVEKNYITEGPNRLEVGRQKFSVQKEMNFEDQPLDEGLESPEQEDLDDLDEDSDLPPERQS